eukprot:TRINITY_DN109539_c0_g1_i1.p1 TRINITY_DN109539_c0_g1~~TRINITY_DN109539_c0_g1_i1.p1  ORF type:complete len:435 (+),score=69.57 TRINITY_DN109539_c0_g1_i1:75-1379(+)
MLSQRSSSERQLRPSFEQVLQLRGPSSLGSKDHIGGLCRPCVFQVLSRAKRDRTSCTKGIFCNWCHEQHPEHFQFLRKRRKQSERAAQKENPSSKSIARFEDLLKRPSSTYEDVMYGWGLVLHQSLQPRRERLNVVMRVLGKAGKSDEDVFTEMKQMDVQPNVFTYNAFLSACAKVDMEHGALDVFAEMKRMGVRPNEMTYSSLITACLKVGNLDAAFEAFNEMKRMEFKPSVIVYSALADACVEADDIEKAFEVFNEMKWTGLKPHAMTYSSLIRACMKIDDLDRANEVITEMKWIGMRLDMITCNTLVSAAITEDGEADDSSKAPAERHELGSGEHVARRHELSELHPVNLAAKQESVAMQAPATDGQLREETCATKEAPAPPGFEDQLHLQLGSNATRNNDDGYSQNPVAIQQALQDSIACSRRRGRNKIP